MTFTALFVLTI